MNGSLDCLHFQDLPEPYNDCRIDNLPLLILKQYKINTWSASNLSHLDDDEELVGFRAPLLAASLESSAILFGAYLYFSLAQDLESFDFDLFSILLVSLSLPTTGLDFTSPECFL
mmetsp:Transcript_41121/g.68699  ORF Transcript_41121/g.68699 Transcript_41121/m.68699 type:complete len:115 (+) Transcript_41121:686-1030(+)